MTPMAEADPDRFIHDNLRPRTLPGLPRISLLLADEHSGLSRLLRADDDAAPPYWAFAWSGGMALAHYLADHPETVSGKPVLDLGSGCGIVAIAAAQAGASGVVAVESDAFGRRATAINAERNHVTVEVMDSFPPNPIPAGVVLAGDVFYDSTVAAGITLLLDRALGAGCQVLVGDPGRRDLPRGQLQLICEYDTGDFGDAAGSANNKAGVYRFVGQGSPTLA